MKSIRYTIISVLFAAIGQQGCNGEGESSRPDAGVPADARPADRDGQGRFPDPPERCHEPDDEVEYIIDDDPPKPCGR